jgi:hypothetical protein
MLTLGVGRSVVSPGLFWFWRAFRRRPFAEAWLSEPGGFGKRLLTLLKADSLS